MKMDKKLSCVDLYEVTLNGGCAMAQLVSCWPLTMEARVSPCAICGGQRVTGTGFSLELFSFPLSVSFHHGSPHSYISPGG
jgi:hypothetical protein